MTYLMNILICHIQSSPFLVVGRNMSAGFDCEFVEDVPSAFQCHCPICLLVLREPYHVTCCGKSFCKECIQRIVGTNKPCPTCSEPGIELIRNKGLQQALCQLKVFCSNKESGCDWQGELGQLDQHLNLNPEKDKLSVGCAYTEVKCLYTAMSLIQDMR